MEFTLRHPPFHITVSPIPCNGPVYHLRLLSRNQIILSLRSTSEAPAFHPGCSTAIGFLVVKGKIFQLSQPNLIKKATEPLISWLVCRLKTFPIGLGSVRELRISSFSTPKRIWPWLEMGILQWIWNRLRTGPLDIDFWNEYFDDTISRTAICIHGLVK